MTLFHRWSPEETKQIAEVRERLGKQLTDRPQFPEVVGDRKIIRFLRGHNHSVDKVCEMMSKHLEWRDAHKVDEIRDNIVWNGMDHPSKFPCGQKILKHIPTVVIAHDAHDNLGAPICVDQYNFSPTEVLKAITLEEYIIFIIHTLEYKTLIIEQLSEQRERVALEARKTGKITGSAANEPYGVLANICVIRDLGAVGFEHIGARGQEIIKAVIGVASDNYPELMRKCFMINTPWLFNTLWYVIKSWLPARTINKVSVMGTSFKHEIEKEIDAESLPSLVGGKHVKDDPYVFDRDYFSQRLHPDTQPATQFGVSVTTTTTATTTTQSPAATPSDDDYVSLQLELQLGSGRRLPVTVPMKSPVPIDDETATSAVSFSETVTVYPISPLSTPVSSPSRKSYRDGGSQQASLAVFISQLFSCAPPGRLDLPQPQSTATPSVGAPPRAREEVEEPSVLAAAGMSPNYISSSPSTTSTPIPASPLIVLPPRSVVADYDCGVGLTASILSASPRPSISIVKAIYLPQKASSSVAHFTDPTTSPLSASDASDAKSMSAKHDLHTQQANHDQNMLRILNQNLTAVAELHQSLAKTDKAKLVVGAPAVSLEVAGKRKAEIRVKISPEAASKLQQQNQNNRRRLLAAAQAQAQTERETDTESATTTATTPTLLLDNTATDTDSIGESPRKPLDDDTVDAIRRGYHVVATTDVWSSPAVKEADALVLRAHTFFPRTFSAITSSSAGTGTGTGTTGSSVSGSAAAASFAAFRAFLTGVVWEDCDDFIASTASGNFCSGDGTSAAAAAAATTTTTGNKTAANKSNSISCKNSVTAVLLVAHVKPLAGDAGDEEEGKEEENVLPEQEEEDSPVVIEEAVFLTAVQTLRECMPAAYTLRQVASSDGRFVCALVSRPLPPTAAALVSTAF